VKILYFYQYFSTPNGSWGTRVYDFASEWVKQGHEVTVVTSVYVKSDLKPEKFLDTKYYNGIQVKIINTVVDNRQSKIRRIWTFLVYAVFSSLYALSIKTDIVVASSGPITVGLPGLVSHYFRKRKLVFEVRDLWPEGAIELGIIRSPVIIKFSHWFEKRCYKAASLVVCLSPGMKEYVEKKHRHNNVVSITNSADLELFNNNKLLINIPGLNGRNYAIYSGNIGEVNNSSLLLAAAAQLRNLSRNDIVILLIGDGQQREELNNRAKLLELDNFIIHGLIPKTDLVGLIQNSVASIVPLLDLPVLDTSSPNKFFEALAAGVPVIQTTKGWMKDFLNDHGVGFTVDSGDAGGLAELLISLSDNPDLIASMKEKALWVAKEKFDKHILAREMLNFITGL